MPIDGGRIAARGFEYQYLRTLEALLDMADDQRVRSVRIEGPADAGGRGNAVDFDVVSVDGTCALAVQVKSKAPGGIFEVSDAVSALVALVRDHDAVAYQVLANGEPSLQARQLSSALGNSPPGALPGALEDLLASAPARLAQVRALTAEQASRLSRCRLVFDDRDVREVRACLRERLREYRNRVRHGLGETSAGLLTGFLVAEILRRAADPGAAEITASELRSLLLVDGRHLSGMTGVRDWGVIVGALPPVPDVARPAALGAVIEALDAPRGRRVRQVALVGLSGIGKSSLACAYIHDRADSYDCIFWVNASDRETLLGSFRRMVSFLRPADPGWAYALPADQVLDVACTELGRLPGRWAVVFDNVSEQRLVDPWIPQSGDGDVLITSIDSAARYGSATVVRIGPMTESESGQLLGNRLHLADGEREAASSALARLASGLSCWPLALELAAGYIDACGLSLGDADGYLARLKIQSLSDQNALPPGYPRTVAAAVAMCVAGLRHRAAGRVGAGRRDAKNAALALEVLASASLMAARQVPAHMLAAAALVDPPQERIGVWLVDPGEATVGEVIRELRRFSLVTPDEDLPPVGGSIDLVLGAHQTIAINSVVQELLRPEGEPGSRALAALDRLADHVQRWLSQAMELNALERASVMLAHADMLAAHLRHYRAAGKRIALLFGNLAGAHGATGDYSQAQELLLAELDLVDRGACPDELLAAQAKISLVGVHFIRPDLSVLDLPQAVAFLEDILGYCEFICGQYPDAAVKLGLDIRAVLTQDGNGAAPPTASVSIVGRLDELLARLDPTAYSEIVQSVQDADALISEEKFREAEDLSRHAISADQLTGIYELEARRILTESLAKQRQWQAARDANKEFRKIFGTSNLHTEIIKKYVGNIGFSCAWHYLFDADASAGSFLGDLLEWPILNEITSRPADGSAARIRLLAAIRDLAKGDHASVRATLQYLRPASLAEGRPGETRAWCALWQATSMAAFQLAYQHLPE
jgi:tetratricopeptide (TPR) repeat protein